MVTTPGSSSVSAPSKPLTVEHVWHTCAVYLLCSATSRAYRPYSSTTSQLSVLNQSAVPQVSYRSQGKDFLHFLSEFFNFSLALSILPSKGRAHSSLELVSPQCFQHTLFCQEGLQWVPQSTYHSQLPAPSLLENTTSKLRAEWETIEGILFFFQEVIKWSRQDKEPKNLTVSILFPIFNI